jgi:hypothetical protein
LAKKLIVEIVGDSRSYERALKRSATATNQFGQAVGTTNPKLGKLNTLSLAAGGGMIYAAGAAGGLAVAIGAKSVSAASDLNEQLSRTEVIMGDAADSMVEWSETTATSMGISQRAALAAAGTFAGLFQTVGVQQQKAADLSQALVQLAADLASLQNSSPEEALIALRSGLAGEAEPLRRFNIFLTEARVNMQALTETGKDNVKSLTQQEKTLARYSLIMQDSTLAQGNFKLTSEGLANQQRILRAQVDDLSTQLGSVLIPAVTGVVGAMNDAISAGKDLKAVYDTLAGLPGIEIPVKFVRDQAGGRGGDILRHVVLGTVSPLALGITIGKEIADGIRSGAEGAVLPPIVLGRSPDTLDAAAAAVRRQRDAERAKAGNLTIAQITKQVAAQSDLNVQLANSEKRAAHIRDLLREGPNNAKLQQRLTAELVKQEGLRQGIASAARSAADATDATAEAAKQEALAARDTMLAWKDLATNQATLTKGLQDDLSAAKDRESTLERLVALNRADVDLANQLVSATQARRDLEKEIADNKKKARIAAAFKALGLTPEGETPAPSAGALLKRATTLQETIKGTVLDTDKTKTQLQKIVAFLKKHLKGTEREIRQAILDMLNGIADTDEKKGPLTKQAGLNTKKILEGMGLSPEEIRELRGRLSNLGAGSGLAKPGGGAATRAVREGGFGNNPVFVESHTTINLDGNQVARVVTKQQQRGRRRNPQQKRGPHRIGGV